jgi:hypothetical protein
MGNQYVVERQFDEIATNLMEPPKEDEPEEEKKEEVPVAEVPVAAPATKAPEPAKKGNQKLPFQELPKKLRSQKSQKSLRSPHSSPTIICRRQRWSPLVIQRVSAPCTPICCFCSPVSLKSCKTLYLRP